MLGDGSRGAVGRLLAHERCKWIVAALLLSVVALVCARSHACGKPGSARGRAPWRVISPSERQRPLEVALVDVCSAREFLSPLRAFFDGFASSTTSSPCARVSASPISEL